MIIIFVKPIVMGPQKLTIKGYFQTILVIPEINFSATFTKLCYLCLKNILDNNDINWTRFKMFNNHRWRRSGKSLIIKKEVKIASNVVVVMYLSIKSYLVNNSISYFKINLPKNQQSTIELCLKIIVSGMSSTLLKFGGKHFVRW